MPKYEYVELSTGFDRKSNRVVTSVNDTELRPSEPFPEYINRLGDAGWELVAAFNGVYILKRQK